LKTIGLNVSISLDLHKGGAQMARRRKKTLKYNPVSDIKKVQKNIISAHKQLDAAAESLRKIKSIKGKVVARDFVTWPKAPQ
jgi:hypothetical protein